MWKLIASRLAQAPLIVLVIYTLTLALAWAAPGNPLDRDGRRPLAAEPSGERFQLGLRLVTLTLAGPSAWVCRTLGSSRPRAR